MKLDGDVRDRSVAEMASLCESDGAVRGLCCFAFSLDLEHGPLFAVYSHVDTPLSLMSERKSVFIAALGKLGHPDPQLTSTES